MRADLHSAKGAMTMTPLQTATAVVAAVFLLVGVAGFVPGVTTDYGAMELAGHESGAMLLGVFQVSILHNVVHLVFGLAGLVLARSWEGARAFLLGGGMLYLLLFAYGLTVGDHEKANLVPLNNADDWLHLALGAGMVALGFVLSRFRKPVIE